MKTLLFLHFRNFGDAVIGLGLVEAVRASRPGIQIDVLSRPEFAYLFENHPGVRKLYTADFPIGTLKRFSARSCFRLIAEVWRARTRRYDAVANLFGDVRENLAGWLIAPRENYGIVWPDGHPVRIQSRTGPTSLLSHPVFVANNQENIYTAMASLGCALGSKAPASPVLYQEHGQAIRHNPSTGRIGFHVSAGQECKRWPIERWYELAEQLLADGSDIRIYCAPYEKAAVESVFSKLNRPGYRLAIVAGPIAEFLEDVASCEIFLGHDSFGIHAAAAIGVPRILINGPNIAEVWSPPGTLVAHGDEELSCFPCYGKPTCTAGSSPYACIRHTSVEDVKSLVRIVTDLAAERVQSTLLMRMHG